MPDMIAAGSAWFEGQRRAFLTVPVDYRVAGSGHPIPCGATIAVGRWEAMTTAGQIVRMETRDFIIADSELRHMPAKGDTITLTESGIESVYRVVVPDGQEQAWRWADRSHTAKRIHTLEHARYEV